MTVRSPLTFSHMTSFLPGCEPAPECSEGFPPKERAELARSPVVDSLRLRQVLVDQLGHIKHGNLLFATENLLQIIVSIDHSTLFGVLKIMFLYVLPKLLGNFSSWLGFAANYSGEFRTRLHWLHECRVRCTTRLFLGRSLFSSRFCSCFF